MGRSEKKISEFDVRLGAVVRSQRVKAKIAQQALAEQAGIPMSNYRRREDGINEITVSELERIAHALAPHLPGGTTPLKLVEEALRDYGGIEKLMREHGPVSDDETTLTDEDNVPYAGHVQPDYRLAADKKPGLPPLE